jgi:hypothetical protein
MFTRTWTASDGSLQIVISLHRYDAPTAGEWSDYIQALTHAMVALNGNALGIRGLSISDGGGPNGAQREQLNAFMRQYTGGRGSVAIVTANAFVRTIIKALSWFNPQARGFAPDDLASAIDYLGLTAMQRSEFEFTLNEALVAFPIVCVRGKPSNLRLGWSDHSPGP